MKENKAATFKAKVHPDILVPPHIGGKLIDLLVGEWSPDASEQEQLAAHLAECRYCRTALIVLLSAEQKYARENNEPEAPVHDLLMRFARIHHAAEVQNYEYMGAYAEAIVAEGREEADKRFPLIAEHIRTCPSCKATVETTVDFLNESEGDG